MKDHTTMEERMNREPKELSFGMSVLLLMLTATVILQFFALLGMVEVV
jgi:hypothetical protein